MPYHREISYVFYHLLLSQEGSYASCIPASMNPGMVSFLMHSVLRLWNQGSATRRLQGKKKKRCGNKWARKQQCHIIPGKSDTSLFEQCIFSRQEKYSRSKLFIHYTSNTRIQKIVSETREHEDYYMNSKESKKQAKEKTFILHWNRNYCATRKF